MSCPVQVGGLLVALLLGGQPQAETANPYDYLWLLKYEKAKGKSFSLADFHDRALDQGALPVPWLENILLQK